ncbi:hypothetical protein PVAND_008580 [Polypedilum vanderplanki]|uniref:F-box domain-containing protein n=1 Tax=Polypedilum vanderplanki TaxID=319348 RepID=A0A9J6CA03_POLVA|nr:hypothetical protein PVAND_008580 [Polypedilum vanderplanki]
MENIFEILPDEILIQIFNYLDNNSMWKAMHVCKQWTEIFGNSSKLMNKFVLEVQREFMAKTKNCENLPDIPIKNVIFYDVFCYKSPREPFKKIIQKYQNSITNIEISDFKFQLNEFIEFIEPLQELTYLKINNIEFKNQDNNSGVITLPKLKSLTIVMPTCIYFLDPLGKTTLNLFKFNKNIESLTLKGYNNFFLSDKDLNEFLTFLPNLRNLDLTSKFFLNENLPNKLETLKIYTIEPETVPFLKNQKGNLKWLHMHDHPRDPEIYKFIFDEMKLEKLTVSNLELISKGKIQTLEKLSLFNNLESALNLVRRCGPLKEITIGLNDFIVREFRILSNQPTECFANLEKLQICYYSCDASDFRQELFTFLNKCKGIKILHFQLFRNSKPLDCLKSLLLCFPDLEELKIDWQIDETVEAMCKVIKKSCRKIKTLMIKEKYRMEARRYFFFRKLVDIRPF